MFSTSRKYRLWAVSSVAVLFVALTLVLGTSFLNEPTYGKTISEVPDLAAVLGPDPAAGLIPASGTFAPTVKQTAPAVVSITVSKVQKLSSQGRPLPSFGPGFEFGPPSDEGRERRGKGAGSGVIISKDGYIVTNHHVIKGAEDIKVHLSGKAYSESQTRRNRRQNRHRRPQGERRKSSRASLWQLR